ncbi:unnamed protein product [Hermetia illucens]|uniref:Uncharacterized protein n=1 Tax=Hermetia illucens TaxID=343691 RepID=A0A7R8YS78_HERIL|nr:unnamed protein product [Hermetia illucens]
MPVAVHLVEVLALITALGMIVAFTFFIVAADRILFLALLIVKPLSIVFTALMYKAEAILLWTLNRILYVAGAVGTSMVCGDK